MVKRKKQKSTWFFKLIFILGFLILIYPQISNIYYRVESSSEISAFEQEKDQLPPEERERRLALARAFNESLVNTITEDPYAKERQAKGRAEYARMLELHEQIGHIQIPSIDVDLSIRTGTSEEVLKNSAGHLEGTSLPIGGSSTHTVITAHSGLPTAKLFTDLRKMKMGERFYIHTLAGTLVYKVDQIKKVEPSHFEDLLVVSGQDYATLLTCTPIMVNSHRLLVRGHRVPYDPAIDDPLIHQDRMTFLYKAAVVATLLFSLLMLGLIFFYRKKSRDLAHQLEALSDDVSGEKHEK